MNRKGFDDLSIDRIEDIYMKRNPDNVYIVDIEESKPVAPEKGKLNLGRISVLRGVIS